MKLSERLSDSAKIVLANMLLQSLENEDDITYMDEDDFYLIDSENMAEKCTAVENVASAVENACIADGIKFFTE